MTRTHRYTALLLALLLVGAAAGPSVVAAQDGEDGFWGAVPADDEAGLIEQASAAYDGLKIRLWGYVSATTPIGDDPPTASENADAAIASINDHNGTDSVAYLNNHVADGVDMTNYDAIKVVVTGIEEDTETFYVTASVADGNVTDFEAVRSTNKSIDYTVEFESSTASEQLSEDIGWLHDHYVAEGQAPNKAARNRFAATYKGALNVSEGDA